MIYKRLIFLFCVCSAFVGSAQSDNCATATSLTECTIFNASNTGATVGADDSYIPVDICAGTIDNTVWFSFTASATGPYTFTISNISCSGSSTIELAVFSGTCGSLTALNCDAGTVNPSISFNASAGSTYFIVVDGSLGSDCTFDAIVCPGCNVNAAFSQSASTGAYPLTVTFTNLSTGGQFYHWDFGILGATFDGLNSSYTYTEPGTFIITLTTFNGVCTDTITDTIVVTGPSAIQIPNVFTPNDDKENDVFKVTCIGIKSLDVQVFNRWGELVGSWSGINGWWDGYSVMAGIKVSEGAYFYRVKAEGIDGTVFDEKGNLQLFR